MSEIDWQARALAAEAALVPFAAERGPSPRRTIMENGSLVSPLMQAQNEARRVLDRVKNSGGVKAADTRDESKFLRLVQHHLEDCATYLRTLYRAHRIHLVDQGIDPEKVDAIAKQVGVYRDASSIDLKAVLDELDTLMEGYDWVGTGSSASGDIAHKEWLDLRARLRRGIIALGSGKLELETAERIRVTIQHDGSAKAIEQFGRFRPDDPPERTFEGRDLSNARPFIDATVQNPRVVKVQVGLYQSVKG